LGSATSRPGLVIWSLWTPSRLASPEGIGPVWQLTAVDTATRYAIGALVAGDKSARDAVSFVDHLAERLAGIGAELAGVLTDIHPEWRADGACGGPAGRVGSSVTGARLSLLR
jgi:hypothetical protein